MATNKNFTFGTEIESYEGQMKEASPIEGLLGGILGQTEIGEDGTKYINAKAKHLITNALPSVRTMDRSFENVTSDDLFKYYKRFKWNEIYEIFRNKFIKYVITLLYENFTHSLRKRRSNCTSK